MIITPSQWLAELLKARGLNDVTHEALFTYQLSELEYLELKNVVRAFHPKTVITAVKHKAWAACFVLCCAEWYRREYQSHDRWSWSAIWSELGFELSAMDISSTIPLGLESYWHRSVRLYIERRNFLGSVFIEGGLPFQLISTQDNKFSDLIRKILHNYYQVDLLGIGLSDLILRYSDNLPKVFSEDGFIDLIGSIVRNLMALADKVDRSSASTLPSEQLDTLMPNWRNQFPIPLDNETGKGLLNNWLIGASSANSIIKKHQSRLSCKHVLDIDNMSIVSQILLPQTLNFEFDKSKVTSSKLDLCLLEGAVTRANFGSVYAQFDNGRAIVKARKKGIGLPRKNINAPLFLDISESGSSIERMLLENSSLSIGEVPVGFVQEEQDFVYAGQASFTTKAKTVFALVPETFELEVLSGNVCELKEIPTPTWGALFWYEINGDVRFICGDDRYRICTNSTANTSGMLAIDGQELSWETKPQLVYKGMPKVKAIEGEVDSTFGLITLIDHQPVHSIKAYQKYGQHSFSVINNQGDTLLKRKIAVLPEDLDIQFKCTAQVSLISVTTAQTMMVSLQVEGASVKSNKNGQVRTFSITPNDLPPAKVSLFIQANLECEPIEVILPYPADGVYAYDAEGERLPKKLTISQLLGSEVYLYSNKEYTETFRLEFALKPITKNSPTLVSYVKVENRPKVLNLYSFKEKIIELMSMSDDLDAQIQLTISCGGSAKDHYTIQRFSTKVKFDSIDKLLSIERGDNAKYQLQNPLAMRIAEPERKPVALSPRMLGSIELDRFELPKELEKSGPWLFIPGPDAEIDFRPTFFVSEAKPIITGAINSIQSAIHAFHPKHNPIVIDDYLFLMADNIENSGWIYLRTLWENFGYLPLSTFQVWKSLAKSPKALTIALFVFEMNEEFLRRFDAEFPVLWELFPYADWEAAQSQLEHKLMKLGLDNSFIEPQVNRLYDKFSLIVPSYPTEVIGYLKAGLISPPLPEALQHVFLPSWKQELIREHAESDWPNNFPDILERAKLHSIKALVSYPHFRQASVVLYPVIAAGIAVGKLNFDELYSADPFTYFSLKQHRDFDPTWFSSMYSFFVSYFSSQDTTESL